MIAELRESTDIEVAAGGVLVVLAALLSGALLGAAPVATALFALVMTGGGAWAWTRRPLKVVGLISAVFGVVLLAASILTIAAG